MQRVSKPSANKATKRQAGKPTKSKKPLLKQTKRSFGGAPQDPRFSTINADVDRVSQARQYPLAKITNLENGLRVASQQHDGELATIGVFIDAGSRYESSENNGVAHFLEHTLFKGTNKRNRTQLEVEIENMGGTLNAHTSREQTTFTATVMKKNIPQAIELLGDIMLNSKISERAIEDERSVILEEMESVSQDVQETLYDKMHASAFRGSSLAFDILGPTKNINKISRNDILQYIKTHYTAPRMGVVAVGDVDHAEIQSLVSKHFSALPTAPVNGIRPNKFGGLHAPDFVGSLYNLRDDDMPKVHLGVGFHTFGANDADNYALMTLQMMLGNYSNDDAHAGQYASSEIVANASAWGLADSITPFNTVYSDTGLFGLYAVANCNQIDVLTTDLLRALIHHSTHVPEQGLREAKAKLQYSLLSQYEGTSNACEELGRQMLTHGRTISPVEVIARVNAVDQMAVQNIVKKYFVDQDFVLTALGNTMELQDYPMLRKKTYLPWF